MLYVQETIAVTYKNKYTDKSKRVCFSIHMCYSHLAEHSSNLPNCHMKLVLLCTSSLQVKTLRLKKLITQRCMLTEIFDSGYLTPESRFLTSNLSYLFFMPS